MPDDKRTDEDLIAAYLAGDRDALSPVVNRYYDQIGFFLLKNRGCCHKDQYYRDEVRQKIFLKFIELLKADKFIPRGPGTVRSWLYETAQNICYEQERQYAKQPAAFDKKLLDVLPSDLTATRPVEEIEQTAESISAEADRILATLSEEDRLLLRMVNDEDKSYSYKEIQAVEPFTKYKETELRQKTCRLRKFLFKEVQKWQSKRNK